MNAVPALVAGVGSLAVASPPKAEFGGLPNPLILAACALLGVDEVYAVGGAQAIAMFAYGVEGVRSGRRHHRPRQRLRRCRQAAGAGPVRHRLRGRPDRDRHPGRRHAPRPPFVAADLVAQAEHDPLAACLLVTDSDGPARRRRCRARQAGGRDPAPGAGRAGPRRPVRARARRRPRPRPRCRRRVGGGAPRGRHRRRGASAPCGCATRARSSSAPYTPVSLGDYLAGLQPRAADRRHGAVLGRACRRRASSSGCRSSSTPQRRSPRSPRTSPRSGSAEDLLAHVEAVQVRVRGS